VTDISVSFGRYVGAHPGWGPTWRFHTNLYKFEENILHKETCGDLNLGESLCIVTFFLFSDSGLNLFNGFDFYFDPWVPE